MARSKVKTYGTVVTSPGCVLNLRQKPDILASVIDTIPRLTRVEVITENNKFLHVINPLTGKRGYVSRDFIKMDKLEIPEPTQGGAVHER